MDYILNRSKRKTLSICVTEEGEVIVKAPLRLPQREIDRAVSSKEQWVLSVQQKARDRMKERVPFEVTDGAQLLLLGRPILIGTMDVKKPLFAGDTLMLPAGSAELRRAAVIGWYRQFALHYLEGRVAYFAPLMGLKPAKIGVGGAKKRWGSCNSKGSIRFSYRLIVAPPEAVDYVVVHELAHLKQMNHSAAFYSIIRRVLPDYKKLAAVLKEYHNRVDFDG